MSALEHIDNGNAKRIYGLDTNQSYLDETQKRLGKKIKQFELVNVDIVTSNQSFIKADFIWAAVIFEIFIIEGSI